MRQTGAVGILRLVLLMIGFVLFVTMSAHSVRTIAAPEAIGSKQSLIPFTTSSTVDLVDMSSSALQGSISTVASSQAVTSNAKDSIGKTNGQSGNVSKQNGTTNSQTRESKLDQPNITVQTAGAQQVPKITEKVSRK